MKTEDLLILGVAAAGLYMVWKATRQTAGATAQSLNRGGNVNAIAAQSSYSSVMPAAISSDPSAWYYRDGA